MAIEEDQLHEPRHRFCWGPETDDSISFVDADCVLEEAPEENPDLCDPNFTLRMKMDLTMISRCCSPMLDATQGRYWKKLALRPTKQTDRSSTCILHQHHEQSAVTKKAERMAGSAAIALLRAQRLVRHKSSMYKFQHRDAGFQSYVPNLSAKATRFEAILTSRSCMQIVGAVDFKEDDFAKLSDVAARDCAQFQRGTHVSKNNTRDSRIFHAIQTSPKKSSANLHVLAAQFSHERKPITDGPTKNGEPYCQIATGASSRDSAACSRTARFRRKALEKRLQTDLVVNMNEGRLASFSPSTP